MHTCICAYMWHRCLSVPCTQKEVTLWVSWNPKQEDAIHFLPVRSASQMSLFWICSLHLFPFCFSIWWYCGRITSTAWKFVTQCHHPNIAQDAGASNHLRSGFCGMVNCHSRVCILNGIGIHFSNSEKKQRICIVVQVWAITFKKLINCHDGFQQLTSPRGHFLWSIEWQDENPRKCDHLFIISICENFKASDGGSSQLGQSASASMLFGLLLYP